MHDNYTVLDVFEYSAEAQVAKTKLEAEGLQLPHKPAPTDNQILHSK